MTQVRAGAVAHALAAPVLDFVAALGFLTRVPVRADARTGAAAFGLVGALIGIAACWPLAVFSFGQPLVAAVLSVATLALVSGALHLDGLADTADALAARDTEAAERARRDPSAGPAGVVAISLVLAVDVAALAALVQVAGALTAALCVIASCAVSRAAAVIGAVLGRRRTRPGLARWFVDGTTATAVIVATGTAVIIGVVGALLSSDLGPLIAAVVGLVAAPAIGIGLSRLRAGLDGDVLGAVVESTFAIALLSAIVR